MLLLPGLDSTRALLPEQHRRDAAAGEPLEHRQLQRGCGGGGGGGGGGSGKNAAEVVDAAGNEVADPWAATGTLFVDTPRMVVQSRSNEPPIPRLRETRDGDEKVWPVKILQSTLPHNEIAALHSYGLDAHFRSVLCGSVPGTSS